MALPGLAVSAMPAPTAAPILPGPARTADGASRTARSDQALAELFDRCYSSMCRLAYLLLRDSAAAEDAVADAFTRVAARWWLLRDHDQAEPYVRRAVVNTCRDILRRRRHEQRANATVYHLEIAPPVPPRTAEVDDRLRVRAAIDALPPRQRVTVVLRYYADLSEAEIAESLQCSVGTVKSQLSKARAHLARTLADGGEPA